MHDILIIWDYSEGGEKLLAKASSLAELHNAKVQIAAFVSEAFRNDTGNMSQASLQETIESVVSRTFSSDIQIDIEVVETNDVADWVIEAAKARNIDLVIKTGHRTETLFYTPTDWKLIRNLQCNLLIASPQKWRAKPVILTTVDVDCNRDKQKMVNSKVLQAASDWSKKSKSKLEAIYVIPIARAMKELDVVSANEVLHKNQKTMEQKMQLLLQAHKVEAAATHIKAGVPAKEISSVAAKSKADLVVMGSVGNKGLKGLLLGNTAEKVIHKLRTDLLVIRP